MVTKKDLSPEEPSFQDLRTTGRKRASSREGNSGTYLKVKVDRGL